MRLSHATPTARILAMFILAAGCGAGEGVGDALDELATITLDEGELAPIVVERQAQLGADRLPACVEVSIGIPNSNASLEIDDTPGGCRLIVHEPDLRLLDRSGAQRVQAQTGNLDVDGVRSGSVVLEQFELRDADGARLDLGGPVASIGLYLGGEPVLAGVDPAVLQQGEALEASLPTPVLEEVKRAVRSGMPANVDVAIEVVFADPGGAELPDAVWLGLVLQPRLRVNVVDAAL